MTPSEIRHITKQRLHSWTDKLVAEHATPMLLLGVGHDHKSGQWVLCTLEEPEFTPQLLAAMLRQAISVLETDQARDPQRQAGPK